MNATISTRQKLIFMLELLCIFHTMDSSAFEEPTSTFKQLFNAVIGSDVIRVKKLLEQRIDLNATYGQSADPILCMATELKNKEIVELLVKAGAHVNIHNIVGITPLHIASRNGYNDIVKFLLSVGADVEARINIPTEPGTYHNNFQCATPAMYAKMCGHQDIVKVIKAHVINQARQSLIDEKSPGSLSSMNKELSEQILEKLVSARLNAAGIQPK